MCTKKIFLKDKCIFLSFQLCVMADLRGEGKYFNVCQMDFSLSRVFCSSLSRSRMPQRFLFSQFDRFHWAALSNDEVQ